MTQTLATGKAKSALRRTQKNGFTLIEMVVVIAVIAIVTAIAIPAIAKQSPTRALQLSSQRLQAVFVAVCEMADRDGRVLAMTLSQRSYGVREFREARWIPLAKSGALQDFVLPENIQLALWINQRAVQLGTQLPAKPQLVCVGSADLPDFRIEVKTANLRRALSPNVPRPGQTLTPGLIINRTVEPTN